MNSIDDTIAAIATPRGTGGIAVVRVSGQLAIASANSIFAGSVPLMEAESHRAYYGKVIERHSVEGAACHQVFVDEAVVTVFRAPRSYTREDVVEISCHGSPLLSQRILELLLGRGCRLAEPGEFTQRAFLNGRFDLSQAEAVADIIRAKTDLSLRAAVAQFTGVFSGFIKELRQHLIDVCSLLELELDFAEEDVRFADREEIRRRLEKTIAGVQKLLRSYRRGKILREGVKLVIAGKPNVGKSSLLNALLKEERAIVTDIPGTTRDVLEEQLSLGGVLFRVVDTAGVRETHDIVELAGVRRTLDQVQGGDLVLFMFDGSAEIDEQDRSLVQQAFALRRATGRDNGVVAVINKIDLPCIIEREELSQLVGKYPIVEISARELMGIDRLGSTLVEVAMGKEESIVNGEPVVTHLRHKDALERANGALDSALHSLDGRVSSEFVAVDLRTAMDCLGEIVGEVTTEDILGNIFSKFCIGK